MSPRKSFIFHAAFCEMGPTFVVLTLTQPLGAQR